jgi:hypothetical protein
LKKNKNSIKIIRTKLKIKGMWIEIEKKKGQLYTLLGSIEKRRWGGGIQPPTII